MKRWSLRLSLIIGVLFALTLSVEGLLIAQDAQPVGGTKTPAAATDNKKIHFTSPNLHSEMKGNIRITTIPKGTATQEDATFSADLMVVETQDKISTITCTGNPVFTDTETRITSDKVVGHTSPRWAEFTGHVKMIATPKKKDNAGDLQQKFTGEPTTITSDSLNYDYGNKVAQAHGNVVVVQKSRTLWANEGTYDQQAKLITLKGNVHGTNTGEEELKQMKNAELVTVSLENDWIDMTAPKDQLLEFDLEYQDTENPPANGNGAKTPPPAENKDGGTGKK